MATHHVVVAQLLAVVVVVVVVVLVLFVGNCIAVHGTPSHSYGVSLAI